GDDVGGAEGEQDEAPEDAPVQERGPDVLEHLRLDERVLDDAPDACRDVVEGARAGGAGGGEDPEMPRHRQDEQEHRAPEHREDQRVERNVLERGQHHSARWSDSGRSHHGSDRSPGGIGIGSPSTIAVASSAADSAEPGADDWVGGVAARSARSTWSALETGVASWSYGPASVSSACPSVGSIAASDSTAALGLPGTLTTRLRPITPTTPRERSAIGVTARPAARIASARPGTS